MNATVTAHLCAAGLLAASIAAAGQATSQSSPSQSAARASADQVTISGCVISETEYRKVHDAGRGGVAGTGVGAGNEFILTQASGPASAAARATGTAGTSGSMNDYELSGPGEGQLSAYVNKKVELTGHFKAEDTNAAGQPTGGPTAGAPPRGVDVGGKDLKLREFEVASVRESSGSCSK
jgi:hypothetical protein